MNSVSTELKLKFQPKFQKSDFSQLFGLKIDCSPAIPKCVYEIPAIEKMRSDYCHKVLNDLKISNRFEFCK